MLLEKYWPTQEEINDCIKSQAEASADAVLLAVHQPTPLAIREAGSLEEKDVVEHDLLTYFLSDDLPEGTLLLPITGTSGAGKSHIVRWLAAQLHRVNTDNRFEVVLIPKSANIRTVVDLILEPLSGNERYEEIRSKLKNIVSEVEPQDAATRFLAELKISLRNLANQVKAEIKEDPRSPKSREMKLTLDHAQKLPVFFSDAEVHEYFEINVLAPIIERSISGADFEEDESAISQFSTEDFILPDEIIGKLGSSSQAVQLYYQTTLDREDGKGREQAVDVLNSVIDESIQRVFRLDQAIGGVTLEEIILHIRELLLEDQRELVLLIEDFAALSGIQQVLLKVCIQEAVRAGKQVRSRMRTALAVTDGYLASRDTILTRAKREWLIKSSLEDPVEVVQRTVDLVGAYLNAARWGSARLQAMFDNSIKGSEEALTSWASVFDDEDKSIEESELLNAFGTCSNDVALFPFNAQAIHALAESGLKQSGKVEFNPRRIIDFILRKVLLMRQSYEDGTFPGFGLGLSSPSAEVASWLSGKSLSADNLERIKNVIVIWGGSPETLAGVSGIRPNIFKAFGLPSQMDLGQDYDSSKEVKVEPVKKQINDKEKVPKSIPSELDDAKIAKWRSILDEWSNGQELGQQDALKLRSVLTNALERYVDWNSMCMSSRPSNALLVIPNARGNDAPAKYRLQIVNDHKDPSGVTRKTLLAAIRLDLSNNSRGYDGFEEDSALLANMLDDLVESLEQMISEEREREVASLVSVLIRQGRVLGLVPKRMNFPDQVVQVSLSEAPEIESDQHDPESDFGRWSAIRREAARLRVELIKELHDRVACFQGVGGKKPLAVDCTRIPKSFSDASEPEFISNELRAHIKLLAKKRMAARLKPLLKRINLLHKHAQDIFGEQFDKKSLLDGLKNLMDVLEELAIWPEADFSKRKWKNEIERFRQTPLVDVLNGTKSLTDENTDPSADNVLDTLGRLDINAMEQSEVFFSRVAHFVAEVERQTAVQLQSVEGVDPVKDAEILTQKMTEIEVIVDELIGEGTTS